MRTLLPPSPLWTAFNNLFGVKSAHYVPVMPRVFDMVKLSKGITSDDFNPKKPRLDQDTQFVCFQAQVLDMQPDTGRFWHLRQLCHHARFLRKGICPSIVSETPTPEDVKCNDILLQHTLSKMRYS